MTTVTANELKTRGIGHVESLMKSGDVGITMRGKVQYIIIAPERYDVLRETELEYALRETENDVAAGRIAASSIDEHIRQVNPRQRRLRRGIRAKPLDILA